MDIVQLPAQYAATVLDFTVLKRPKRFWESVGTDPAQYIHPYAFLASNVSLAVLLYSWAASAGQTRPPDTFSHGEATVLFAGTAALHAVIALLFGHLAAFLLHERVETRELFAAFCYTSVFYLAIAPLTAFVVSPEGDGPRWPIVWTTLAVQVLAAGYLLVSMAHASTLHGRRLLAYISVAGACVVFVMTVLSIALAVLVDEHEHYAYAPCYSEDQWPLAAITLPANGDNFKVVVLTGASVGRRTHESFQFGSTTSMKHVISATDGVGYARDLAPNTTYYFRYVTTHGKTTCFGHVQTFKTVGM